MSGLASSDASGPSFRRPSDGRVRPMGARERERETRGRRGAGRAPRGARRGRRARPVARQRHVHRPRRPRHRLPCHGGRPPHHPPEPARPHRDRLGGGRPRRGSAHRGRVRAQGHQPLCGRRGPRADRTVLPGGGGARRHRRLGMRRGPVLRGTAGGRDDAAVHAVPRRRRHVLPETSIRISSSSPTRCAARRCSRCPRSSPTSRSLHAAAADVYGNVQFVGTGYADRLLWRAAARTLVQVERIVSNEEIRRSPERTALLADGIVRAPFGAHPFSSPGFYLEDREHIRELVDAGRAFARSRRPGPVRGLSRPLRARASRPRRLPRAGRASPAPVAP